MSSNTAFLTLEDLVLIHEDQVETYGGSSGIRDLALLESALFRPQSTFGGEDLYPSLFEKAASLMHSIILNHPFVDGNKRTGTVAGLVFLEFNAYSLDVSQKDLVDTALKIATKKLGIEEIAEWLEKNSLLT